MAPSESGEGEDDDREQEQEAEREASDCEQAVGVHSVGEHGFPLVCQMIGPQRRWTINETGSFGFHEVWPYARPRLR